MTAPDPGELRRQEVIHWEHPAFRRMFERKITPTNLDGWLGIVEFGPIVVFEFKHRGANPPNGQTRAFECFRRNLTTGSRFIYVEHNAPNGHVYPEDVINWQAYQCGPRPADFAEDHGDDVIGLIRYVSRLDPFGPMR